MNDHELARHQLLELCKTLSGIPLDSRPYVGSNESLLSTVEQSLVDVYQVIQRHEWTIENQENSFKFVDDVEEKHK